MSRTVAIMHFAGPPYVGGVEVTIAAHARALAADGCQVRILAGKGGPPEIWAGPYASQISVCVRPELGSRGELLERVHAELARGVVSADFEGLAARTMAVLDELLAGVDALMVHNALSLHKNQALTSAMHRLQRAGRLPRTLAWCHDFAWLDPIYLPELHPGEPWSLLKTPLPGVEYVVVSEDRRPMLAGLFGIPATDVRVITPGVDLPLRLVAAETLPLVERLQLLPANPLLLLPARITRRKNIQQAIRITAALRDEGMRPHLLVTGPLGPHNPANARLLQDLLAVRESAAAGDLVTFLCLAYRDEEDREIPVSDAMMADLYRLADALLFTSEAEGYGIPIDEAIIDRLPIFCSDIPVFHEHAGAAATYFPLDPHGAHDQRPVARAIGDRLRGDPWYARRRAVRLTRTWQAIYQRQIKPLLQPAR